MRTKDVFDKVIHGIYIVIAICISMAVSEKCAAQQNQQYKYYFFRIDTYDDHAIIIHENRASYGDIDSLVCEMKKGKCTGKEYASYSDIFNALSKAGLEFVQMTIIDTPLGIYLAIWRRRIS
jgi:hypothetical protein